MRRPRLSTPALLCTLPLALLACRQPVAPDPRTDPPRVRVTTVAPAGNPSRAFTGIVAARVQSDLGFRVAGKVAERLVDAGQVVKRGQPLMRLDPIDLKLAARAQRDAVVAARARATQAIEDEARYRRLRESGAISASAYDQVRAAADSARAQLSAARAQARVANNATGYAELLADGDGVVMATLAEPGQVVSAGQAVVRLAHAGQREALVQLPETLRPAIGSAAQATQFGRSGQAPARLRQLSEVADAATRTFEARYVLDGELARAPLGSTVTILIPAESAQPAGGNLMQVPIAALFDGGKGPGVWAVGGKPERVSWQPVGIRQMNDEHAQVTGELKPGERIIALGAHLLREGQQVRTGEQPGSGSTDSTDGNGSAQAASRATGAQP